MKTIAIILVYIIILAQASCKKESVINPDTISENPWNYKSILDVKWYKYFYNDSSGAYFHNPYFFDNYVIFCSDMIVYGQGQVGIGVYNKQTGVKHPAWNHEPGGIVEPNRSISDYVIGGYNRNIAVFTNSKKLYAYNLTTGQSLWSYDLSPYSGLHRISVYNNYVFQTYGPGGLSKSWIKIGRFNCENGQKNDILQLNIENNYEFIIAPPATWISPSNDTILLFLKSGWNFPMVDGKVDAYAFNVTKDSILWRFDDICIGGNASSFNPIISNNKVVFQCLKSIHCFDIPTGQLIWEHEFAEEGFAQVDNLFADGKLFARSGSRSIMAFDIASGGLLWKTKPVYGIQTGDKMGYYKGKLYFTGIDHTNGNIPSLLFCLNASDGSLLWKDSGVVRSGMKDGIIIDQATGYLYANDSYRIMCIDLNNTPKPK